MSQENKTDAAGIATLETSASPGTGIIDLTFPVIPPFTPDQPWTTLPQPWELPYPTPTDVVWPGIPTIPPMPQPFMPEVQMTPELQKLIDDMKRREKAAKKDAAMLGDSGYERIGADFYPTPPENVDVLLQHFQPINGKVWEPACGDGAISKRLIELGYDVASSDLFDYGYGISGMDFLAAPEMAGDTRSIITNPPYADMVDKFIRHALKLTKPVKGQVAMFLRNEIDCGKGKMDLFGLPPFHAKIVVTKRPRWIEGSKGSPRHNYAWFIWDWRHIKGPASVHYAHPSHAKPLLGPLCA